ncbi:lipopolysaccharide-induced tumor necrosis factor-alpha factor homolog isoform X3 [Bombyx mori]|uniref:lipopolysaccharide-induced tumor necrosis factor-alpha factor homolog isoform X3 n=1 Tax=Bombyx mori TaxID=7091 RepID=UPI002ED2F3E7
MKMPLVQLAGPVLAFLTAAKAAETPHTTVRTATRISGVTSVNHLNFYKGNLSGANYGPPPQNPPPYNYQPQQVPYANVPIVPVVAPQQFVTVVQARPMGPEPSSLTCPSCTAVIVTRVQHDASSKTHLFALILCLIGCWPCACIPYCMESCQNATHYCPNCNAYIGTYTN